VVLISWAESNSSCEFRSVRRLSLGVFFLPIFWILSSEPSQFGLQLNLSTFNYFIVKAFLPSNDKMSMFSGLTNQISGWVANKTGQGDPNAPQDPNAMPQDPNAAYPQNGAEGEVPMEGDPNAQQGAPGMAGMAQGFLAKAMAAKDGVKEKASAFQPPNLGNLGGGVLGNITSMIPGQRREEEVPNPPGVDAQGQMVDPNMQGMDQTQMVDPNQYQQYDQTQYQQ